MCIRDRNKAYPLTGNESIDYDEVAAILSDVLGRPINYSDPSLLRFARRMRCLLYTSRCV